jgi:hypothetical protein
MHVRSLADDGVEIAVDLSTVERIDREHQTACRRRADELGDDAAAPPPLLRTRDSVLKVEDQGVWRPRE